jgi:hypothetical protein
MGLGSSIPEPPRNKCTMFNIGTYYSYKWRLTDQSSQPTEKSNKKRKCDIFRGII